MDGPPLRAMTVRADLRPIEVHLEVDDLRRTSQDLFDRLRYGIGLRMEAIAATEEVHEATGKAERHMRRAGGVLIIVDGANAEIGTCAVSDVEVPAVVLDPRRTRRETRAFQAS